MVGFRKRPPAVGLFDDLKGKGIEQTLDVPVAIMVPMVAMMWADEQKHEAETAIIHDLCNSSPVFLKPDRSQINEWIDAAEAILQAKDMGEEKACKLARQSLTTPLCETAFAFAILVLFADEKVKPEEKSKAEDLAGWLGIKHDIAREIIKVVSILRHGRDAR